MVTRSIETDYLVVGAGAMGMAFTDALVDHADVHVTLVDRRHAAGGHWQDAYPFVQLHQASVFYGVASTVLGHGTIQESGPEAGLQERARQPEIRAYYDDVLHRRFLGSGRVTFLPTSEYQALDSSHLVTSLVSGETLEVHVRRRVVDATYLAPTIPATTPAPFGVAVDARVIAINDLARLPAAPSTYVIVGSGKTATDGIVWLLANGVQPERIVWVRPRDPWMLNRAVVQPDPVVALGLAADTMAAAADAESLDDLFLRLEAAGVMLRIDRDVTPTMAKTPTLGTWELDLLRTIENVVRLGHIEHVTGREIVLDDGVVPLPPDSLVVHCAASGLTYPPLVPIWAPDKIRLQTIRAGFPCFNAALAGYVEATRDDDRERNRLCPANTLPNGTADWAWMQARGILATRSYGAEQDIAAWTNGCALNPARIEPSQRDEPAVQAAFARLADVVERGFAGMTELAHTAPHPWAEQQQRRLVRAVLEGLLIAGLVVWVVCVLAAAWVRHRLRRRLRIAPRVPSKAPTVWIVSPTAPARLHRRLCTIAASARLASTLDPGVAPLADDLVAEAVAIEPRVIAVARTRRAGWSVRRDLSTRVSELEVVARRLATLSSEPPSPAEPLGPTRLLERVSALEEARQELAEIELRAGLLRHS